MRASINGEETSDRVIRTLSGPALRAWLILARAAWRDMPQPPPSSSVSHGGPRPLELIVVGTGPIVGLGSVDHDVALAGHLARAVGVLLQRGVELAIEVDVDMSPRAAAAVLTADRVRRVDGVILMLGMREALRVSSLSGWRADLRLLFDQIASVDGGRAVILAVDIPPVPSIRMLRTLPRFVADRYLVHLNTVMHDVVAEYANARSIRFLPAALEAIPRARRSDAFRIWAGQLAAPIADQFNAAAES